MRSATNPLAPPRESMSLEIHGFGWGCEYSSDKRENGLPDPLRRVSGLSRIPRGPEYPLGDLLQIAMEIPEFSRLPPTVGRCGGGGGTRPTPRSLQRKWDEDEAGSKWRLGVIVRNAA